MRPPVVRAVPAARLCYNQAVIDRASFDQYVREALGRLYDRPYLRAHPLAELLTGRSPEGSGRSLHPILLEAIEHVRPPRGVPAVSPAWRQYRYLVLRYVEGIGHESIARELGISVRQARREHTEALGAVASTLWDTYRALDAPGPKTRVAAIRRPEPVDSGEERATPAGLDAEVVRVGLEATEQSTELQETVESIRGLVESLAATRAMRVELTLPPAPLYVATSRTVLRQLLLSILSYAAEVAPRAVSVLSASESAAGVGLHLLVEPGDPPVGRESSEAETVLTSARYLAEAAGGALDRGQTTTRSLYLNVTLPSGQRKTVLIIDDDPDMPRLLGRYLAGSRYRAIHARTAPAALHLARTAQPDVIILDVLMPTQDGWDIVQRLREQPETSGIPIIVCSVLAEGPIARSLGIEVYLSKPVTRQRLLSALDRCFSGPSMSAAHPDSPSRSP
ncbi:MAG: response regulator [Chloroflexi bacterium]|nr:response regulator [Chloroflexota bacterium]